MSRVSPGIHDAGEDIQENPRCSHLQLVDEHCNRVQLIALVLAFHDVVVSRVVVRWAKERMAVVQDLRGCPALTAWRG